MSPASCLPFADIFVSMYFSWLAAYQALLFAARSFFLKKTS
jgi:hypothetical protein